MNEIVRLEGVCKRVNDAFALRDVNLSVPGGTIVGLLGVNGAGKTTLMRVLLGLAGTDGGSIRIFGHPFGKDAPRDARFDVLDRVGAVFDTCPYPTDFTVRDVARSMKSVYSRWDGAACAALLDGFGLAPKTKVKGLSRGMGMKLQLAVALSHNAQLLVLDEPTAGLDPIVREEVLVRLGEFVADDDHAVLMSSHITSDFEHAADRVVGIDAGRMIFDLPREDITDAMGIARCRADQAALLIDAAHRAGEHLTVLHRPMSVDVLVRDRFAFAKEHPGIACDRMSIDEVLQFALKGGAQ